MSSLIKHGDSESIAQSRERAFALASEISDAPIPFHHENAEADSDLYKYLNANRIGDETSETCCHPNAKAETDLFSALNELASSGAAAVGAKDHDSKEIEMGAVTSLSSAQVCFPPNANSADELYAALEQCSGPLTVRAANVNEDADYIRIVNGSKGTAGSYIANCLCCMFIPIGTCYLASNYFLVDEGLIGYSIKGGKPLLHLPGYHTTLSPVHRFVEAIDPSVAHKRVGPVTFVLIKEGELGFATDNGAPVVLLPGRHVYNSVQFKFSLRMDIDSPEIVYQTISVVTIPDGQIGFAVDNNAPQLLMPGRHVRNSKVWRYKHMVSLNEKLITFKTMSIITVETDEYGFALDNGYPQVLLPGRHVRNSPVWTFGKFCSQSDDKIEFNSISIITVSAATYGFGSDNGMPQVLLPGRHVRNSPSFKFECAKKLSDKLIEYGPITIIIVETGEVGIGNNKGDLIKLDQGQRYEINSTTFKFEKHLPVKQSLRQFEKILIATQDGVQMEASGLLTFQLVEVEKLLTQVEIRELDPHIERITRGSLVNLFTKYPLKEIMQAIDITRENEKKTKDDPMLKELEDHEGEESGNFRSHICDGVAAEVQKLTSSWGVKVLSFQLQSLLFFDAKFARNYENATLSLATTEVEARSADITNRIKVKNARADAEAVEIEADGRRLAAEKDAEAHKISLIKTAEGMAQSKKIEAEALETEAEGRKRAAIKEAEGKKITLVKEAEGKAEAIEIEARARNEAAKIMDNPLAEKLVLLDIQKEQVASTLPNLQSLMMLGDKAGANILLPHGFGGSEKDPLGRVNANGGRRN